MQSSGRIVSGFKNRMYSPVASFRARLFALLNHVFAVFHMNLTLLNLDAKKSLLPSVDLLSITIISASIFSQAFTTERRHCSRKYFTLKLTMITESFNGLIY